jgi:signal transduction histidine kinase
MIRLVPAWMEKSEEFWEALKRRNLFFIKLRYLAVAMLFLFNFFLGRAIGLHFTDEQHKIVLVLSVFLLVYNLTIHFSRKFIANIPMKFNSLHLSLLQIIIDLTALTILVYITGGIESPLKLFFIFHIIIGSLILPGYVIYIITSITVLMMVSISYLEYFNYIPHFVFGSLYETPLYDNPQYILMRLIVLGMMLFISAFLTNRIANQLYSQEKQLMEALDEINKSEVKKQKYIMGVVHEIKSPIAATKSILNLIVDGFVGEISLPIKAKLNRAILRTTESLGMINNILRISRLRLLDEKISEDVDIKIVVSDLLEENIERLNEKSIEVIKSINEIERSIVKGDKFLLQLAISNIISNAVKYTNENGKIWVTLTSVNDYLELSVCDNGIGVDKLELDKIFDNYYRTKNVNSVYQEGAGVGLSLVREITIQHRGKIVAVSPSPFGTKKNPGTCFKIRLPYSFTDVDKIKKEPSQVKGGV